MYLIDIDVKLSNFQFQGCLYVCGGAILEDGDGIDLVQKYDSKTNEWTEAASMLIPRSGSAACVLDKYIYVIGMIRCILKSRRC